MVLLKKIAQTSLGSFAQKLQILVPIFKFFSHLVCTKKYTNDINKFLFKISIPIYNFFLHYLCKIVKKAHNTPGMYFLKELLNKTYKNTHFEKKFPKNRLGAT